MDYTVQIIDADTGEVTHRKMTSKEIAERQKDALEWDKIKADQAEAEALKQSQRAEILAKLGLTEEEAKLLIS